MIDIENIRNNQVKIMALGNHSPIIQSILDFDFLSGKKDPSILGILGAGRNFYRYFFGEREILIPVFKNIESIPRSRLDKASLFLNLTSGRRILTSTKEIIEKAPGILGGAIFAENVPEKHSIKLYRETKKHNKFLIGPASVGLLIPGILKLGAIGGIETKQVANSYFLHSLAGACVMSSSGGMTNEILRIAIGKNIPISFSISFGGDRFPITTPEEAFLAAEKDPKTLSIIYFGELGGVDEYRVAKLLKSGRVKKKVVCYIAGKVANAFETPPQFGHAKALAQNELETAESKIKALKDSGASVAETFSEFTRLISTFQKEVFKDGKDYSKIVQSMKDRKHALIATTISKERDGDVKILGEDLVTFSKSHSLPFIIASLFLGHKIKSKELEEFVDFVLRILVDHGPQVSGALNTIVTSRAGRDLPSSLSSGILTIGPRFGGAINQAAKNFLEGVSSGKSAGQFTEEFASKKIYIAGIGHKKYSVDFPDPRVIEILKFSEKLGEKKFTTYAMEVEKITTAKKGNLILNVDGAIAAVLLDVLSEKEGLSHEELIKLTETEFFNALFILSRSIGLLAHALDQKRLDEGLIRLDEDQIVEAEISE